jgi:hypothetical protein
MRAIVFENKQGIRTYLNYNSEEELISTFKKLCGTAGFFFCETLNDFLPIVEEYKDRFGITTDKFIGTGLYDFCGNFHKEVNDNDGSIWLEENYSETENVINQPSRIKIIKPTIN